MGSNYVTCRADRLLGLGGEEFETAFVWHAVRGGQVSRQHDPVISSVMFIISNSYYRPYMLTGQAPICRNEANKSFVINGSRVRSASNSLGSSTAGWNAVGIGQEPAARAAGRRAGSEDENRTPENGDR